MPCGDSELTSSVQQVAGLSNVSEAEEYQQLHRQHETLKQKMSIALEDMMQAVSPEPGAACI